MALSATVSKVSVTTSQEMLYSITLQLVLTDTAGVGFTKTYTIEYRTGENVADKKKYFIEQMQMDINRYKSGQTIYNSSVLNTAVTDIQTGLTL